MPAQQTNRASETARDAAVLGRDLSITSVKGDDTLVAARSNASIAALDGGLSKQDAAPQTAASTRRVSSFLRRYWRAFQEWRQRRRLSASLHYLSDRDLKDIGLTRDEINCLDPNRAIDLRRDSTTYLWIMSRGVA
jgi:uncharacterized protein YjiS (DUF1127 family)